MKIPYKLKMMTRRIFTRTEGERILKSSYRHWRGKDFDSNNIITFTDKIFNRMILNNRHRIDIYTQLSDKILARDYVKERIGEDHLVRLIWHGSNPNEIPFHLLPKKYVIKTNHGSGENLLVDGEIDRKNTIEKISRWLRGNYYWESREYQYYNIDPKIMIEEFVEDGNILGLLDYRFWCFNGKPEVVQVDNHEHSINPFYDTEWRKLDLSYRRTFIATDVKKPTNFDEMVRIASLLSSDFDFVRVDLYNSNGRILFGELTFTPVAGELKFTPESWDSKLGKLWQDRQ